MTNWFYSNYKFLSGFLIGFGLAIMIFGHH